MDHCRVLARWMRSHGATILLFRFPTRQERSLETHGPFGTLWVGLGLGCFYIALIWLNTLLGFFLTPLFVIPATWLQDRFSSARKQQ